MSIALLELGGEVEGDFCVLWREYFLGGIFVFFGGDFFFFGGGGFLCMGDFVNGWLRTVTKWLHRTDRSQKCTLQQEWSLWDV